MCITLGIRHPSGLYFFEIKLPDVNLHGVRLTGMSGSFSSPLPAATSSISIPSLANSSTSSGTSTVTVGTLSTSLSHHGSSSLPTTTATPSYLTSTSGLSKSITPTLTSTTSSLAPAASKSGASGGASRLSGLLYVLLTIFSSAFFFFS